MANCNICKRPDNVCGMLMRHVTNIEAVVEYISKKFRGEEAEYPECVLICRDCIKKIIEADKGGVQ